MANDLLEQLASTDCPPVPVEFDRNVHQRLNKALTAGHFFDLMLRGLPFVLGHFARAVADLLVLTISGRHVTERSDRPPAP